MILRKSSLLPLLLSASSTTAYFAQVANAHVELVAGSEPSAETVDNRASLQASVPSLWNSLENALEQKSELEYAAPKIMSLFEEWVERFGKEYENVEEKSRRMLVWLENHGEYQRVSTTHLIV